jgi:pimeloyl-ACP methyl ester carboxylesterase
MHHIPAGVLDVAYLDQGPRDGPPVVLLHGFPYDVHAYEAVTPRLVESGCRVVTPYLRGYGPTRFLSPYAPRSGQQAALAHDLLALLDALAMPRAVLAGYDWGGRAACIVAALWPERVRGLVTGGGYNVHHVPSAVEPTTPEDEHRLWYQFYLHGERGRRGLERHRRDFCRLLWTQWSPTWRFDDATFERSAAAFDNPDFVEVVVHSYRVRYGLAPDDPAVVSTEARLVERPPITVPTISLDGADDGVIRAALSQAHRRHFVGPFDRRVIEGVGHNLPQEAPVAFARAVMDVASFGG